MKLGQQVNGFIVIALRHTDFGAAYLVILLDTWGNDTYTVAWVKESGQRFSPWFVKVIGTADRIGEAAVIFHTNSYKPSPFASERAVDV